MGEIRRVKRRNANAVLIYELVKKKNKLKQDNNTNKAIGKEGFLFTVAESVNWCCLMRLMGKGLRIIKMKSPCHGWECTQRTPPL